MSGGKIIIRRKKSMRTGGKIISGKSRSAGTKKISVGKLRAITTISVMINPTRQGARSMKSGISVGKKRENSAKSNDGGKNSRRGIGKNSESDPRRIESVGKRSGRVLPVRQAMAAPPRSLKPNASRHWMI